MFFHSSMLKQVLFVFFIGAFATIGVAQTSKTYQKSIKKHRKTYKKKFLKNEHSPLDKKGIKKLTFFDVDQTYKTTCRFEQTPDEKPFEMATYSGITQPYRKYGVATCPLNGKEVELAVYQSLRLIKMPMYRDYLFIPFKDDTNSESTYGGGRYMDINSQNIQNQEVTLDFNKSYNPYCAYSDGYSCPVPPLENHLNMEVLAGEKIYKK